MGLTRQSVQRIADLLVERGLAEYRDNPAHRRAKLLVATEDGLAAVRRIGPMHAAAATALVAQLGRDRAAEVVEALRDLSDALGELDPATV
jgi:DNA-binding MarR family transcriptional regulator